MSLACYSGKVMGLPVGGIIVEVKGGCVRFASRQLSKYGLYLVCSSSIMTKTKLLGQKWEYQFLESRILIPV